LELVCNVVSKDYAQSFPAFTSHDHLIVENRIGDNVSVAYLPNDELFHLRYFDSKLHKVRMFTAAVENAETLLDALMLRMSMMQAD
jgi:hypothetical protein